MRADIDAGLQPDKVLQVVLTEADKKKYNLKHRRTVARFIKKYLQSKNLPYRVKSFHRDDEGDFFIVQCGVPRGDGQTLGSAEQTLPERCSEGQS